MKNSLLQIQCLVVSITAFHAIILFSHRVEAQQPNWHKPGRYDPMHQPFVDDPVRDNHPNSQRPDPFTSGRPKHRQPIVPVQELDSRGATSWQWLNPLPQGNLLRKVAMLDANTM